MRRLVKPRLMPTGTSGQRGNDDDDDDDDDSNNDNNNNNNLVYKSTSVCK